MKLLLSCFLRKKINVNTVNKCTFYFHFLIYFATQKDNKYMEKYKHPNVTK